MANRTLASPGAGATRPVADRLRRRLCSLGITREIVDYLTLENRERHAALTIHDSIAWAHDRCCRSSTSRASCARRWCIRAASTQHLGIANKLHGLAAAMADEAVTPASAACCGFAGDRGFLHTELTRSATAEEAAEVALRSFDAYLGSNRTCEIGLNLATGKNYESFVFQLEALSRRGDPPA
jgi:D-lactate dehydrogenase